MRNTLVAPVPPLPTSRRSMPFVLLPARYPQGIAPIKKAAATMRTPAAHSAKLPSLFSRAEADPDCGAVESKCLPQLVLDVAAV